MVDDLLISTGVGCAVYASFNVISVTAYEVHQAKYERQKKMHPSASYLRRRPLVSVIITSYNNQDCIQGTLQSLISSGYRNLQIILADNVSGDSTVASARNYMSNYSKRSFRIYVARKSASDSELLAKAYKRYGSGEIVLWLEAGAVVSRDAIKLAVEKLNSCPETDVLNLNIKALPDMTISSVLQVFMLGLRNRMRRAATVFNSDYFADYQAGLFLRQSSFKKLTRTDLTHPSLLKYGDKNLTIDFDSRAVIYRQPLSLEDLIKDTFKRNMSRLGLIGNSLKLLTTKQNPDHTMALIWIRNPLAICFAGLFIILPLVTSYFIYLAFWLHEPSFLLLSLLSLAMISLITILEEATYSLAEKIKYVVLVPVTYSWIVALALLQYLAFLAKAWQTLRRSFGSAA